MQRIQFAISDSNEQKAVFIKIIVSDNDGLGAMVTC